MFFSALLNETVIDRSLPPLIVALVPGQQQSLDKLKAMRVQLSNEVASLINHFGPQLHEDFHEVCLRAKIPSFFTQKFVRLAF